MKRLVLIVLAMLTLVPWVAIAEDLTISGKVSDKAGQPLPGVSVTIKGTEKGTSTDGNGSYTIKASSNAVLIFNYIGYKTKEVAVANRSTILIELEEEVSNLQEVVVVGYGTQKKTLITGAISSVKSEELKTISSSRIDQALQGRTAGVTVLPQSGSPGAAVSIRIRGAGSNKSSDPLYVVDGVMAGGIEYLDPSEIASIEVLKDAASAAIYGANAANGVVLITTKSGKAGTADINYSFQMGQQSIGDIMPMMNAQQYQQYLTESNTAGTIPTAADAAAVGLGTNWTDAVFKNAPQQRHALTLTGGTEKSSYLIGGTYFKQQGVVGGDKSEFKRYTVRLNSDNKIKSWLNIGERLSYSNFATRGFKENDEFGSIIGSALALDPITPITYTGESLPTFVQNALNSGKPLVRDANGNYYGLSNYVFGEYGNPIARLNLSQGQTVQNKVVGNVYADIEPLKGLKLTSRFGVDAAFVKNHTWTPSFWFSSESQNGTANGSDYQNNYFTWQWENFVNYQKSFGVHSFTAMAGMSANESSYNNLTGSYSGFLREDEKYSYPDYTPDALDRIAGQYNTKTLASYFGRVSYDYQGKYLVNASLRTDGSSLLASGNQWGTFPAVSAGWVLSSEKFFPEKVANVMNYVKLRGSWGQNGSLSNLLIGQWQSAITSQGIQYPNSTGGYVGGAAPASLPNLDLTWETSEQLDFGADMSFLNSRLTFSVDWYRKTTKDLLTPGVVPYFTGNILPVVNGGNVQNKGWEFELAYRGGSSNAFQYEVSGNISTLKNEVTYLNPFVNQIGGASVGTGYTATIFNKGFPIWYFQGYKTDGIFQNQAQIDSYIASNGITGYTPKPGEPIVLDVNKDKKISQADQTYIGDPNPDLVFGARINLSYKGFDFLAFLQGQSGNEVMMGFNRSDRPTANKPAFFYNNRWTGDGSTNTWFASNTSSSYVYNSDLMVFDGSFARIRQLQLGYTLPNKLTNQIKVKNARMYVSLDNYFTFTKYPGLDPEGGSNASAQNSMGIDRGVYPVPRSIMAGLSFTF